MAVFLADFLLKGVLLCLHLAAFLSSVYMYVIRDNIQYVCVSFVSVQHVSAVNFCFCFFLAVLSHCEKKPGLL